jgi:hypothetical protein
MELSNPKICITSLSSLPSCTRDSKSFDTRFYNKQEHYCVDGFPKEGLPCLIVLPSPSPAGCTHAYMGIKPAVLIIDE